MTDLEKRKKLLVVESEVYRETLKLELQNLKNLSQYARAKVGSIRTYGSILMLAISIGRTLFSKKRRNSMEGLFQGLMWGWRTYGRLSSLFRNHRAAKAAESKPVSHGSVFPTRSGAR